MFPQSYLTSGVQKLHHKKEGENQQIMMHIFWRKGSLATSKDEKWAALYFVKIDGITLVSCFFAIIHTLMYHNKLAKLQATLVRNYDSLTH